LGFVGDTFPETNNLLFNLCFMLTCIYFIINCYFIDANKFIIVGVVNYSREFIFIAIAAVRSSHLL